MKRKRKLKLSPRTIKFRRHFFFCVLLIFSVLLCVTLSLTVLFKIEDISIEGLSRYKDEEIIKASSISKGSNLFLLNKKAVENRINECLPYTNTINIIKKIPNHIIINVKDANPFGAIKFSDSYVIINASKKVLDITKEFPSNLCIIKGIETKDVIPGRCVTFVDKDIEKTIGEVITLLDKYSIHASEIDMSNYEELSFLYENRIKVILGIPEKLEYKIKTAFKILDNGNIKSQERGTLNLSLVLENEHSYFTPE